MASAVSAVKTKLLVISDTHDGRTSETFSGIGAFRPPFPKVDVLLHSGDLTMVGAIHEYEQSLDFLGTIDAELKLVIAGNHDLSLHQSYYMENENAKKWVTFVDGGKWDSNAPQQAREMWTGRRAQQAGVTYLEEGLHSFTLKNGARFSIYASPWQPEFYDWAFNYPHNEDRWNPPEIITDKTVVPASPLRDPHPIPENAHVDIVMTHGPAHSHLDKTDSGLSVGCPHLLRALKRVRPLLHCSGHIHEGWGAEKVIWDANGQGTLGDDVEILAGTEEQGAVLHPESREVIDRRAIYLDLSKSSMRPLKRGKETLFVNSSIVDIAYEAKNAAFLIDLDLPTAKVDDGC